MLQPKTKDDSMVCAPPASGDAHKAPQDQPANGDTQTPAAESTEPKPQKRSLFLEQAVKAQDSRLDGNVMIARPVAHGVLAAFFGVLVLALIIFASFGHYTRKATVPGSLRPVDGLTKIYPVNTGIVGEIYVQPGDVVEIGQPLLRLERDTYTAEMTQIEEKMIEELENGIASLAGQLDSLADRQKLEADQLRLQKNAVIANLAAQDQQLLLTKNKHAIKNDRFAGFESLRKKNYISQIEMDQLKTDLLDSELQIQQIDASIRDNRQALHDIEIELEKLPSQYRFEAEQIRQQISTKRQALADAKANQQNLIVATTAGKVATVLAERGSVVASSRPLLTIVPEWSVMEAEIYVPASAVSFITEGQDVRLQYQAIPVQRYGTFPGVIKSVSETTINPGEIAGPFNIDQPVYRALVEIHDQNIVIQNQTFPLMPGMLVQIDLLAEKLTILEWLLEPVWDVKERF